jgi:uncharacterized membrane protein (GlpM family)
MLRFGIIFAVTGIIALITFFAHVGYGSAHLSRKVELPIAIGLTVVGTVCLVIAWTRSGS